jgi:hypothetical protein
VPAPTSEEAPTVVDILFKELCGDAPRASVQPPYNLAYADAIYFLDGRPLEDIKRLIYIHNNDDPQLALYALSSVLRQGSISCEAVDGFRTLVFRRGNALTVDMRPSQPLPSSPFDAVRDGIVVEARKQLALDRKLIAWLTRNVNGTFFTVKLLESLPAPVDVGHGTVKESRFFHIMARALERICRVDRGADGKIRLKLAQ